MANKFKLKRSAVPGKVPQVGDLELGELAINTFEGRLYLKKNDGTESIVTVGGELSGQAMLHRFEHTAAAGQVEFPAAYMPGSLIVIHNGRTLSPTDFIATTMTSVVVPSAREGDAVLILSFNTFEVANAYSKGEVDERISLVTAGFRNRLINANFAINQRCYASGAATTAANQYTLDRWRVVVAGQSVAFTGAGSGYQITAPAGGIEQVIEGGAIEGGFYTLSWIGTAAATVNGVSVLNGRFTTNLPPGVAVTVRFSGGTVREAQLEPGTVRTPFEHRPPAIEEPMCLRYYQKTYRRATKPGTPTTAGQMLFHSHGSLTFGDSVRLTTPMRVPPTITYYSPQSGAAGKLFHASGAPDQGDYTVTTFLGDAVSETGFAFVRDGVTADGANERLHYVAEAEM